MFVIIELLGISDATQPLLAWPYLHARWWKSFRNTELPLRCCGTPFGATQSVHGLAERSKHRVHRGLPAVAELERSKLKDFVACSRFPSTA
jgi:hypothetical protein